MPLFLLFLSSLAQAGVTVGSYGRVQASSDLFGGEGDAVDVVSHGTRLEKDPYLELDVVLDHRAEDDAPFEDAIFEIVITPAVEGEPFHYDGEWDADLAMRNLYAEARGFSPGPLSVWAGSRMYRGDDVHLLDFWPLDELNTVGGGADWRPEGWDLGLHAGFNRLTDGEWQVQYLDVADEGGVGTETVLYMDRTRLLTSARVARLIDAGDVTFRVKGYGEFQGLPPANRVEEDWENVSLPYDWGTVVGAQLSAWGWGHDSFVHLFARHATGLAAYGELTVPEDGLADDLTVHDAKEYQVALSGNTETERLGVLVGGYVRRFEDADGVDVDVDDRWEAAVALRPTLFTSEHTSLGLELSQQWLRPDGLNPHTRDHDVPLVTKVAVLPAVQVARGSLARPQIRLQYIYTHLNDDARLWFDEDDVRHRSNHQHFLGVGAEWWLNSRSYR